MKSGNRSIGSFSAALNRVSALLALTILLIVSPLAARGAEKVVICYASASSALVPTAKLQGYYAAEGIDAELRLFPSGRQALEAMFGGECGLVTVADAPVADASLRRNDFRIVATIAVVNDFDKIIVRGDRGIRAPADLLGRRIAVPQYTSAHYFLDVFLVANGLAAQDVIRVFLSAQEAAPAFRRGDVDAVAKWEPAIQLLKREFGSKANVLSAPGLHVMPLLLVGGQDYVIRNPAAIERVLRALLRAERYNRENASANKAQMARSYGLAPGDVDFMWSLNELRVSLDQSLPFILENTTRWAIGLLPPAQRRTLPNFLDLIYFDGLRSVKPEAVTIIR